MAYTTLAVVETMDTPAETGICALASHSSTTDPIHILLAEDEESDVMLTETALDDAHIDYDLHTVNNGAEILPYLRGQGAYCNMPAPEVLMLDLSMPGKDGFEVLAEMSEKSERFGDLPIIILTGDTGSAFLKHSYDLNIAAYLTKPCSAQKIQSAFTAIYRHLNR